MIHKSPPSFITRRTRQLFVCLILFACLFTASEASAHDPGLSASEFRITNDSLIGDLSFASADIEILCPIDTDRDKRISSGEFEIARRKLEIIACGAFAVSLDGRPTICNEAAVAFDPESGAIQFHLRFSPIHGSHLELDSLVIKSLARGHRHYLVLRDENGEKSAEQMLQADNERVEINLDRQPDSRFNTFARFVVLGVEHILTGYDHLAFLFALLLAGSTLHEVLKIISSFTLAHSISLALATFNIVTISPSIVEPFIAASIVYIGFENLIRRNLKHRWLLTFGFGLIHGLGFAAVLRELNIGSAVRTAIIPLLSFNLGVELGQVAIAALILPLIWKLKQRAWFVPRVVPLSSSCVAILGAFWLIERLLPK